MTTENQIRYKITLWLDTNPEPETRQWILDGATGNNGALDRSIRIGLKLMPSLRDGGVAIHRKVGAW